MSLFLRISPQFKPVITYGMSNGINLLIPFIFLPLFTRKLTETDFGMVANFLILFQISAILIGCGSVAAVSRSYWDRSEIHFGSYIFTSLVFNFLIFCFLLLASYLLNLFFLEQNIFFIFCILLSGLFVTFKDYKHKLWNLEKRPLNFSSFLICFNIVNYSLAVYFVFNIFPDWKSRIIALFFSQILFSLISLFFLLKQNKVERKFSLIYLKDIIKYGSPLLIHGLAIVLLASADKLVATIFLDLSSAGILAVASIIASLMTVPILAIDLTLEPIISRLLKKNDKISLNAFSKYFFIVLVAFCISGVCLYLITPFLFDFLIGPNFSEAEIYVPILILGYIFYGLYRFFTRPIFFSKKTSLVAFCTISSGLLGVLVQYYLVHDYGLMGLALGTSFGYFLSFLFAMIVSRKLYNFSLLSFSF